MRRVAATLIALLVVVSAPLFSQTNPPEVEATDEGCPELRIHEYLERHGDYGRIDPEIMLQLSREVKQSLDRARLSPMSIGGETWTSIGPSNGAGRATSVAPHPAINGTAIIGAAGGGAWKTTDGGQNWRALTDDIPNLSAGAIAYAPSNPNVVYLGTGEGGYAGDFIPGIGLLASSDGGETWTLPDSVLATQFYRLSVDPDNPQVVLAATNNGLWRSTSGQNGPWKQVIAGLAVGSVVGYGDVTDLVRDPTNSQVIYVTTWDRRLWCVHQACSPAVSFVSPAVLKSTDDGQTWTAAATGLPVSTATLRVNRLSIAIATSSPSTLYVATSLLDNATGTETSHVYKSIDAGASWSETGLASTKDSGISTYLGTQAWYDNVIAVSPTDPNAVLVGGVIYAKTTDGGTTWARTLTTVHVDAHDLRYDNFGLLWIACDGGIWTSGDNNSAIGHNNGLVTRQFYAIANDPANRNRIYGGQQDNGTVMRGDFGGTTWSNFSGGDGFACAVDATLPSIAYSTIQSGVVVRTVTAGTLNRTTNRTPPYESFETTPFYSIVTTDPHDPSTVYTVSSRVWRSATGGDGWVPLSMATSNGSQVPSSASIRALAISRSDPSVIMFALSSPQRRVFRTTNGGQQWTDVTTGLPVGRTILHLEIDPHDSQHVFASIAGTSGPSVYEATDGGSTWRERSNGLPSFSTQTVRFDPTDSSTLYAGTDVGVYRSTDDGANWSRFGTGMPAVSVYSVEPLADGTVLRAATHGRGIWELTIPQPPNTPPAVTITSPAVPRIIVSRGSTLSFSGSVSDADDNPTAAEWTFSDTWNSVPVASGATIKHRFDRAGRYPAALAATDSHGGIGAATVEIDVVDASDSCASPTDISPAGPFPYSVTINTDLATKDVSDPHTVPTCYPYNTVSSQWLTFTPAATGDYQFSLYGSSVSSILVGYTGDCGSLVQNQLCIIRPGSGTDVFASTQTVTLTAGQPIRLLVANYYSNDFGEITVTVTQNSVLSPVVTRVSPATGGASTPIVINGNGFQSGATVTVGGVPAQNVTWISAKLMTAVAGPHAGGDVAVTVKNPDGTSSTLESGFTYASAPAKRRAVKP